jgi:diacylglycerol kinase
MKRAARSLGFAVSGLVHAFRHERNLKLFALGHIIVCLMFIGVLQDTALVYIIILSILGGFFIVVELLNTAIERLADTFDDCEKKHRGGHYHPGIKMTKDVAAAASLVALSIYGFAFLIMCYGMYLATTLSSLD